MLNDAKWTTLAQKWMFYLPPGRPSNDDLNIIQQAIQKKISITKGINALILGSTPEYRDLLSRLGANVTVVDRNSEMIESMGELRVLESYEQLVVEDWFNFLPRNKRAFDLILADLTQGNIHYDKHEELYRLISNALTRTGYFFERTLTFRTNSAVHLSADLLPHFANCPLNLVTLNEIMFKLFFTSDLVTQTELVDVDRIIRIMQEQSINFPGLRKFTDFMRRFIFGKGIVWYYGRDWSCIAQKYFKHLQLVEEIPDTKTVYAGFVYIIISTPN